MGNAAYPLRNITRVYTFLLTPRRGEAIALFLKRAVIIVLTAAFALILTSVVSIGARETAETVTSLVVVGTVVGLGYGVVELVTVLAARAFWVLTVETSGASTALVTSRNVQHLHALVGYVVNAIENPETEFQVRVERPMVNHRHYHFGDNVNIYGGSGNTGMAKS